MQYHEIGKTGMKVSSLSFGASSLGGVFHDLKEKEGIQAVFTAVEAGMNFIDVSPYYGHYKAETVLGKALKDLPRDRYYLSTKVGRYGKDGVNTWDYSAKRVTESVYESMERLHIEFIDLINVHDIEFADLNHLYDLLRAVRLRHPRLTAPLDLLYCQAVGLAVFLFVLRQSDGQLRGFILLGGLGGGILFFSLLSRPLRPVWDFWMDRWMELFQFLSLPGRFCAAVCKKFAFQAKTLFYFLRKYATIHIEGVWKPLRKGGMSHGKARQTRKKEKIR